jgi:hypothetical protein
MTIYRVENPNTEQGLWYSHDAKFNPLIRQLSNAKCRDLPMGFDELYSAQGRAWYSGTDSIEQMQDWLPWQDLVELQHLGYGLYELDVQEFKQVPGHVIYTRESIIASRQLPMEVLKAK